MLSDKCTLALAAATLSAVALGSPSQVAAQDDRGFYIGLGAGQTKIQDLKELCDDLTAIGGVVRDCDDKGTGWKAFVGYQFIKYLGVELGYLDMGKGKVNVTGPGGTACSPSRARSTSSTTTSPARGCSWSSTGPSRN